ncbi:MAG: hypothetical protein ABIW82_11085 [Dokdonella sp.]
MKSGWIVAVLLLAVLVVLGVLWLRSDKSDEGTFTLYDGSATAMERVHIATFDSAEGPSIAEGAAFNKVMCEAVREALQEQATARQGTDHYWCDKGRFRP